MIRIFTRAAVLAAAGLVAACQMMPGPAVRTGTAMDGQWRSADGVFVATFADNTFTSVDAKTNAVLARGSYAVQGSQVNMQWLSTRANEQRFATCSFISADAVRCEQPGATPFLLSRA